MELEQVCKLVCEVAKAPPSLVLLGEGPIRALKKVHPQGCQPLLLMLLNPTLGGSDAHLLKQRSFQACEGVNVFLLTSFCSLDVTWEAIGEGEGSHLLLVFKAEDKGAAFTLLEGRLRDYELRHRQLGVEVRCELRLWGADYG